MLLPNYKTHSTNDAALYVEGPETRSVGPDLAFA